MSVKTCRNGPQAFTDLCSSDLSSETGIEWSRAWTFREASVPSENLPRGVSALSPASQAAWRKPSKVSRIRSPRSPGSDLGSPRSSEPSSPQQTRRASKQSGIVSQILVEPQVAPQRFIERRRSTVTDDLPLPRNKQILRRRTLGDTKAFTSPEIPRMRLDGGKFFSALSVANIANREVATAETSMRNNLNLQALDVQQVPCEFNEPETPAAGQSPYDSDRKVHPFVGESTQQCDIFARSTRLTELQEPDSQDLGSVSEESVDVNVQRLFNRLHYYVEDKIKLPQPFYGVPLPVFANQGGLRKHEWLLANDMLVDCTFQQSHVIFVVHEWYGVTDPDPKKRHFAKILEFARDRAYDLGGTDVCIWIDFCCVPQHCEEEKKHCMEMIPGIIRACDCVLVVAPFCMKQTGGTSQFETLVERGWCSFELLSRFYLYSGDDPEIWISDGKSAPFQMTLKQRTQNFPLELKFSCCERCHRVPLQSLVDEATLDRISGAALQAVVDSANLGKPKTQNRLVPCDRELLGPILVHVFAAAVLRAVRNHGGPDLGRGVLQLAEDIDQLLPEDVCATSLQDLEKALGMRLNQKIVKLAIETAARGELMGTRFNIPDYFIGASAVEMRDAVEKPKQPAHSMERRTSTSTAYRRWKTAVNASTMARSLMKMVQ
eukprot:gnl/MRDRNA2_/MRDRNA2_112812_c0_seq1.p1 gnl/MRDRNA2_/MRDRNA2_112812_c0~~gnl/MRDRNA2_/MRDRNA2_112812_c0_seq1.p1  ORF type:complete len:661 (-),score=103.15 gnl/MRDRNA2_/MRDRNA2_112812_c0_seq1:470-2452(-)